MKQTLLIFILLMMATGMAHAQKYTITTATGAQGVKFEGVGLNNNRITFKTSVKGHKIAVKTPRLTSNKYLKLVNVAL